MIWYNTNDDNDVVFGVIKRKCVRGCDQIPHTQLQRETLSQGGSFIRHIKFHYVQKIWFQFYILMLFLCGDFKEKISIFLKNI